MQRDKIDFGQTKIPQLFMRIFIPSLMGLFFGSLLNLADGIFVGRGVGSDALAAVNIVAPIYQIVIGIALMFGSGVSIVAAIHLAKGNPKAANINITQAFTVPLIPVGLLLLLLNLFPHDITLLFGGSERLVPYVVDYLRYGSLAILMCVIVFVGMFTIRLDGSPNFVMMISIIETLVNVILDYLFVFPLGMGIKGAAIATTIACVIAATMVLLYFIYWRKSLTLYKPKLSKKAIRLTLRNTGYMMKLGVSTFIGETALSIMMIVGNFMFMRYLHEDGVAAFSVACYLFPLVFMIGNAVAQSALPIISYNLGLNNEHRIHETFKLSITIAAGAGIVMTMLGISQGSLLVSWFLEPGIPAWEIGVKGFPLYSLSFAFFALNLVFIGYYQSIEEASKATIFMLLRGYILIIPCFLLLPQWCDAKGLWLATPVAEFITFCLILAVLMKKAIKKNK